ncbi:ThuA domain-containing protein [Agromyces sp. NPDC058136]|uniref:ThuA domain-containing protein n=1 Tax=Agromyces sp. NPDC058136 TaxID=3346354 RepID=UPI0036DD5C9C
MRQAIVVRGGWEGHQPVEATELFLPFLRARGFEVRVEASPEVYADPEVMARADLVVPCVTMGEITPEEVEGLRVAVENGTGLVGWHGGVVDSYRGSPAYLQLVGGQFVAHPMAPIDERAPGAESSRTHAITFTEQGAAHPVTRGLMDFELTTEQYWVATDELNDVLATTVHPMDPGVPWKRPVTAPAVWAREWGAGRILVVTPGHDVDMLSHPTVRTIIERGMLWAARTESE